MFAELPACWEQRQKLLFSTSKICWLCTLCITLIFIHRTRVLKKRARKFKCFLFSPPDTTSKIYVHEMYYSSNTPSRKQLHYKYLKLTPSSTVSFWSGVLHLTLKGMKCIPVAPTNLSTTLARVTKTSYAIKSALQQRTIRARLFYCSLSVSSQSLGTRYFDWSHLSSWSILKSRLFSTVCKRNFVLKTDLGLLCFSKK